MVLKKLQGILHHSFFVMLVKLNKYIIVMYCTFYLLKLMVWFCMQLIIRNIYFINVHNISSYLTMLLNKSVINEES